MRSSQASGRAPELLQAQVQAEKRRQALENPEPAKVVPRDEQTWWIQGDGNQPVQVLGAKIQEVLDSRPGDLQVCAKGSSDWVLASTVGFTVTPVATEQAATGGIPQDLTETEQKWEAFPDNILILKAQEHNLVQIQNGSFDRPATVKALAAAGVLPS